MPVTLAKTLENVLRLSIDEAKTRRHEFLTLEHVLLGMTKDAAASKLLQGCGADPKSLAKQLDAFFLENLESLEEDSAHEPEQTPSFRRVLQRAALHVQSSGREQVDAGDVLAALFREPDSHAVYLLEQQGVTRLEVLNFISHGMDDDAGQDPRALPAGQGDDDEEGAPSQKDPLKAYCSNLNERAAKGFIDPLIGRAAELQRTIQVLCRRRRNNPIYVGEPGVGKTAIVEGLALAIHEGKVPEVLKNATIYSLDMGALLAGTKFRGQFEERLKGVVEAIKKKPDAILFIDEIHTIVGAGATSGGSMDASNLLKPALATGEMKVIGSTTFKEYKASFEKDRALERRFQRVEVLEPSVPETIQILEGLRPKYEAHHGVTYTKDALTAAAELSAKYINDRHLPDKAIDVIDEAGAADRMLGDKRKSTLGVEEMEAVVARMARIPPKTVSASDEEALSRLEPELKQVIFGQDKAIEALVSAIKLSRSGLAAPNKPIGSFLFSGPTGVGKTELSKQLARVLGVEFLRFDMTEYMEKHAVSRLIGAPPGYVGYDEGGLLTDAIRKTPYAVLVLDEIEKAHPDIFNILLQVMDNATLTDNMGRKADFRHVILVLTTNAGAREMSSVKLGFGSGVAGGLKLGGAGEAKKAIEKTFSPEFRNRIDAWISFDSLAPETIARVVDKNLKELEEMLAPKKVKLEVTPAAKLWFAEKGFDPAMGARPMARLIQNELKKPLAELVLFGKLKDGGTAKADVKDDKIVVTA